MPLLTAGAAEALLQPPINVLRLSLHPDGLAPRIINLAQWAEHILIRLRRQAIAAGDPALFALYDELASYPAGAPGDADPDAGLIAVPLHITTDTGECASSGPPPTSAPPPSSPSQS